MEYAPHVKATATSIWGASRRYLQFACANQPLGGAPANPAEVTRWCISDEVVRVLIQQSSSTSASIASSARAGASLTADMVAQDGLAGLRLLNPARTCAALGEARVIKCLLLRFMCVTGWHNPLRAVTSSGL
jgi:hypothetical protein